MGEALAALHRVCDDVRFLGSYPRADGRDEQAGAEEQVGDAAFAGAQAWLARVRAGSRGLTAPHPHLTLVTMVTQCAALRTERNPWGRTRSSRPRCGTPAGRLRWSALQLPAARARAQR